MHRSRERAVSWQRDSYVLCLGSPISRAASGRHTGIQADQLADWTVENVRIAGNGWAGWDGDIEGDDSNSGILTFRR
jgi:hypothetical protein